MPKAMADGRMLEKSGPMPFDGKRLIYGGFETLVESRGPAKRSRHHARHHPIPTGHEHREAIAWYERDFGTTEVCVRWCTRWHLHERGDQD